MTAPAAPHPLRDILLKVCAREDLTRDEARAAFLHLMSGEASEAVIGGLLVGLAAKGTTVDELVGAATVMRQKAVPVDCGAAAGGVILDTCGTGGSRLRMGGMFNVSTATALIAAGAGVKVVKHGNRSASSKAGSADVLEKLGVKLELSPARTTACLEAAGVCFAFARSHHPAMRFVAPVRTALGIPTIFNLLGPLTNPAKARHQLLGVFAPELTGKLAQVLRDLGAQRAWVVHAEDGLDELSTLGPTRVGELRDGHVTDWTLDPKRLGLAYARLSDLAVNGADEAAAAMRAVLGGEKGPRRDIATLNAAAAMVIAGRVTDLHEGLRVAAEVLDTGLARKALDALVRASNG